MEEAVGSDQVLAGKVVELANSAMYGRVHRVDDLWRAIQVLGFETTRDTALALALSSIGQRADDRWAHLWQHAGWSARAARSLTPFVDRDVGRSAFLCALLHDIGRQLMAVIDPDALDAVLSAEQGGHPDVLGLERRAFGIDHAALGAACLDRWSFRPELAHAVALHHVPVGQLVDPVDIQRVALLQLADALAHAMEVTDQAVGVVAYAASEPARRVLGVRRSDLQAIATDLLVERDEGGRFAA
jgi:putative nucleotidyltransferase with HDIG domain